MGYVELVVELISVSSEGFCKAIGPISPADEPRDTKKSRNTCTYLLEKLIFFNQVPSIAVLDIVVAEIAIVILDGSNQPISLPRYNLEDW